jgi:ribA/ribD-fused uncharacterized protein
MKTDENFTVYQQDRSAHFMRSRDLYGELSNMTSGFPIEIRELKFQGPEGLYQALKFPEDQAHQTRIAKQRSGMDAKRTAYTNRKVRPDWDDIKVQAMRYTLAQKLCQHPRRFGFALISTMEQPIVELVSERRPDDYWGAKLQPDGKTLRGRNVLGKLLTELRDTLMSNECNLHPALQEYLEDTDLDQLTLGGKPVPPPQWMGHAISRELREYREHRFAADLERRGQHESPRPGDPGFWDWMRQRDAEREEKECRGCGEKEKLLPGQQYCTGCRYLLEQGSPLPERTKPRPEQEPEPQPFDFSRIIPSERRQCTRCGNEYRCTPQAPDICQECQDLEAHPEKAPRYWTWTKMGRKWMIAAYWPDDEPLPEPGEEVTVHRKNGSQSTETIREVDGITYEHLTGRGRLNCWPQER